MITFNDIRLLVHLSSAEIRLLVHLSSALVFGKRADDKWTSNLISADDKWTSNLISADDKWTSNRISLNVIIVRL
jgi:hypothetical protein